MSRLLFAVAFAAALVSTGAAANAQEVSDPSSVWRVSEVRVTLDPRPSDPQVAFRTETEVRKAFGVFPGNTQLTAIDFGLARVRRLAKVSQVSLSTSYAGSGTLLLDLRISLGGPVKPAAPTFGQRLTLVDDGRRLLKLRVGIKSAVAVSTNQWFGNGAVLTHYNPRGIFGGGDGPNVVFDNAPSVGAAIARPLGNGESSPYIYGTINYLAPSSVGQDNNRSNSRLVSGWEEAYVGVVGGNVSAKGAIFGYNVSYGMQPVCLADGLLVCQVASSGGARASDFAWPRWSAKRFLKVQVRYNQSLLTYASFTPNDYPSSNTRIQAFNYAYDPGFGLSLNATALRVSQSEYLYYFPTGRTESRSGLRAYQGYAAGRRV